MNSTKTLYESIADDYDEHMSKTGHYTAQKEIFDQLVDFIEDPIIDLACGPGFLLPHLTERFSTVYANDFSKPMIELAKKKTGDKVVYLNFDAEKIKLDKTFKTIICSNLLFYIENPSEALKNWKQLLDEDGVLIIMEEFPFGSTPSAEMDPHRKELLDVVEPISPEKIIETLNQSEFKLVKQVVTPIDNKHSLYGFVFKK